MFRAEIIAWISRPGYHGDITVRDITNHGDIIHFTPIVSTSPRRTQTHSHRSHCHPTALLILQRGRSQTYVKSKCGGYGSCGTGLWHVGLIGLSAYLRLGG